jgi:hypothetical protein
MRIREAQKHMDPTVPDPVMVTLSSRSLLYGASRGGWDKGQSRVRPSPLLFNLINRFLGETFRVPHVYHPSL